MSLRPSTVVWVVAMSLMALGSCKRARTQHELSLALSWVHQAQFAGPYYADQKGLYEKEGLRVELVPGSIDRDPLDELLAGEHDFVIAQPERLIQARQAGHRVKALAATYRIHPLVFIAPKSSGITTPEDFRGKTIGVAYSEKLLLLTLLRKMGIDPAEVTIIQRQQLFKTLQDGDAEVQAAWLINELPAARRAGLKLNVISPYDYGITFYADVLAARESLIEEDPELVQRFVRATMRGWAEALQDPELGARLALHYDPSLDPAHQRGMLNATAPLVHTGEDRIGWMRTRDWTGMVEALHQEQLISGRPPVSDLYTLRFLEITKQR